jgi:sortase A
MNLWPSQFYGRTRTWLAAPLHIRLGAWLRAPIHLENDRLRASFAITGFLEHIGAVAVGLLVALALRVDTFTKISLAFSRALLSRFQAFRPALRTLTTSHRGVILRSLRGAEIALGAIAAVSLGYSACVYAGAAIHQMRQKEVFAAMRSEPRIADTAAFAAIGREDAPAMPAPTRPASTSVAAPMAVLEIPRLGLSSVVEEGDDAGTLRRAIGHIPGTALPGEAGNIGLAAHRDTYFRHLGEVKAGDLITMTSREATHRYRVERARIVDPSAVEVLAASSQPTLTLVTCYPFHYLGPAPKRFVVTAREELPGQ